MTTEQLVVEGHDGQGNRVTAVLEVPVTATVIAVTAPADDLPTHRARWGPLHRTRFFFGPGKRFGWARSPLTFLGPGDGEPVVSFKTWFEDDFTAMLSAAARPWTAIYSHEPEDDVAAGTLTPAAYAAVWARMRQLRDAHPNGRLCRLVPTLNWYQLTVQHFDWRRLQDGLRYGDAIGVDAYSLKTDAAKNTYTAPAALLGPAETISGALGLPWCAPEFGVVMAADGDPIRHAAAVQAYIARARAGGALWLAWYCSTGGGYFTQHPCTDPAYSAFMGSWRTAMTGRASSALDS